MANNDIGGVWRTVGGRRIFIKDGEDLKTAMKNSGKFENISKKNNEEIRKLTEEESRNMYDKLSDEEKQQYDNLKKEMKQAYRDGDNEKAIELKEKRKQILIDKAKEEGLFKKKEEIKTEDKPKKTNYKPWNEDQKQKLNDKINYHIEDLGEEGRIDTDDGFKVEQLYSEIYNSIEKEIGRELEDEDFDYITGQLDAFYKDGFYVSKGSFSLEEYSNKVFDTMEQADFILSDDFDIKVSRSIYSGLVPSRYYEKDGITVRIGDHTNSNGLSPSHTREQLYNSTPQDLVEYVRKTYEKLKKIK